MHYTYQKMQNNRQDKAIPVERVVLVERIEYPALERIFYSNQFKKRNEAPTGYQSRYNTNQGYEAQNYRQAFVVNCNINLSQ